MYTAVPIYVGSEHLNYIIVIYYYLCMCNLCNYDKGHTFGWEGSPVLLLIITIYKIVIIICIYVV